MKVMTTKLTEQKKQNSRKKQLLGAILASLSLGLMTAEAQAQSRSTATNTAPAVSNNLQQLRLTAPAGTKVELASVTHGKITPLKVTGRGAFNKPGLLKRLDEILNDGSADGMTEEKIEEKSDIIIEAGQKANTNTREIIVRGMAVDSNNKDAPFEAKILIEHRNKTEKLEFQSSNADALNLMRETYIESLATDYGFLAEAYGAPLKNGQSVTVITKSNPSSLYRVFGIGLLDKGVDRDLVNKISVPPVQTVTTITYRGLNRDGHHVFDFSSNTAESKYIYDKSLSDKYMPELKDMEMSLGMTISKTTSSGQFFYRKDGMPMGGKYTTEMSLYYDFESTNPKVNGGFSPGTSISIITEVKPK